MLAFHLHSCLPETLRFELTHIDISQTLCIITQGSQKMQKRSANKKTKKKKKAEVEVRPWAELPEELLVSIYQKLDVEDLLKRAPLCCTRWYKASKDPCLWRDVDCSNRAFEYSNKKYTKVPPSDIVEFVINRSQGLLNSIRLPYCPENSSVQQLLQVAQRCPMLKSFDMFIGDERIRQEKDALHLAISNLNEVESMSVRDYFLVDEATLKKVAECCPRLVKLKVGTISVKIAVLLPKFLPGIKELDISNSSTQRDALLVILKDWKELESLDLSGCATLMEHDTELQKLSERLKEFKWDDSYDPPYPYGYYMESSSDSESERYRGPKLGPEAFVSYDDYVDYYYGWD